MMIKRNYTEVTEREIKDIIFNFKGMNGVYCLTITSAFDFISIVNRYGLLRDCSTSEVITTSEVIELFEGFDIKVEIEKAL